MVGGGRKEAARVEREAESERKRKARQGNANANARQGRPSRGCPSLPVSVSCNFGLVPVRVVAACAARRLLSLSLGSARLRLGSPAAPGRLLPLFGPVRLPGTHARWGLRRVRGAPAAAVSKPSPRNRRMAQELFFERDPAGGLPVSRLTPLLASRPRRRGGGQARSRSPAVGHLRTNSQTGISSDRGHGALSFGSSKDEQRCVAAHSTPNNIVQVIQARPIPVYRDFYRSGFAHPRGDW